MLYFFLFTLLLNVDIGKKPHSEASDVGLLLFSKVHPHSMLCRMRVRLACERLRV